MQARSPGDYVNYSAVDVCDPGTIAQAITGTRRLVWEAEKSLEISQRPHPANAMRDPGFAGSPFLKPPYPTHPQAQGRRVLPNRRPKQASTERGGSALRLDFVKGCSPEPELAGLPYRKKRITGSSELFLLQIHYLTHPRPSP